MNDLAINGGEPVRNERMPGRKALGEGEIASLLEAIRYYHERGQDPGYGGVYKKAYCSRFSSYMGGGYTNAVSSGTAAIYVALAALDLPSGKDVLISPVTDSGALTPIILQGFKPVVMDSERNSYNVGFEEFKSSITKDTVGAVVVHAAGEPMQSIEKVAEFCREKNVRLVEDCSQATGATISEKKIGSFGDVGAFSTMYRKNLAAGASSGLVFTRDFELYKGLLGHADRGKPYWKDALDWETGDPAALRDPGYAEYPALNFNTSELSCAIGLESLNRLDETIATRRKFLEALIIEVKKRSKYCSPYRFHSGFSPIFFPIFVKTEKLRCTKRVFASALQAEGIDLLDHYGCLVSTWRWAESYFAHAPQTPNAIDTRDQVFHLFLNERYGDRELADIIAAIEKVERHFGK